MPSQEKPRGIKRKRGVEDDNESRLRRKLYHDIREIRQVTKRAKSFEIQRAFKKLKKARCEHPESEQTKDLEQQMEILKDMDCNKVAHTALMTKIKKEKNLSGDPLVQALVSAELASKALVLAPSGTPTAKAQSRMLSSKMLASEVIAAVAALKNFLHPDLDGRRTSESKDKSGFPTASGKKSKMDQARYPVIVTDSDEDYSIGSDKDVLSEVDGGDGWESGTVSDNDDEPPVMSDGWESGSVRGGSYRGEVSDAASDVGGPPSAPDGIKIMAKNPTLLSKGQSAFLPTLSVGFTRGDSDSEFSDSEAKIVDDVKKNRRGQRARRAIWEKKYGKNANHVKKRQETARGAKGKGLRPGNERSSKPHRSERPKEHQRPLPKRGEHTKVEQAKFDGQGTLSSGRRTERPLHPSWEAKRKQRSANILPAQGTKITFDS